MGGVYCNGVSIVGDLCWGESTVRCVYCGVVSLWGSLGVPTVGCTYCGGVYYGGVSIVGECLW